MAEAETKQTHKTPYDGIIPTGWLTAYGRTFTDIPYSREFFGELEAIRSESESSEVLEIMKDTKLAPHFEARHKLLDRLIRRTGANQILEIAAGLSTRGTEMTSDGLAQYVEVDLPGMMSDKRRIMEALERKAVVPHRPNLYIEDGSALSLADMTRATRHFDTDKPIVIVNEGLMRYLGLDEKTIYANNIKTLLHQFGGTWITSDISLPKVIYKEDDIMFDRRKRISKITGINVADNLFKDEDDAKRFFGKLGFDVESHSFLEVIDELTSPKKLGMPRDYVEAINSSAVAFVMTIS